jgi:hypothetical protein
MIRITITTRFQSGDQVCITRFEKVVLLQNWTTNTMVQATDQNQSYAKGQPVQETAREIGLYT